MSQHDVELAALVPAAAAGDKRAVGQIVKLIYPAVLRYCRTRIGGGAQPAPEDVTQEICLGVVKAIPNYQDQGRPFMAFVYGIASNKVADAHRMIARNLALPTDEVPEVEHDHRTPEEYALVNAGSNEVAQLLDSLSDNAREIIHLRVFMGLSAEETAEAVGSTPGAVRVAQHRALAALRKKLLGQERSE